MGRWPTVGQAPVASTGFCITSAIRAASANTSRTFDDSLSRDCWCALEINNAENVEKLIEFSFLIVTPSPVRRCDIAINTFASVRGIPPGNLGNAALRRGVCAHLRDDRKSVVSDTSVSVRVDLGGRGSIKTKLIQNIRIDRSENK